MRQGASTLAISAPGAEAGPMNTRYQVTIGQTARECAALGGVMTMKVGVQGRVLLGPAGGPGQVDVPLRFAVVQEGPNPKTDRQQALSRWRSTIPPGQTAVPFVHVEQDVTFPMPRGDVLDTYVVYVGFDPGTPAKPERKQKTKKKSVMAKKAEDSQAARQRAKARNASARPRESGDPVATNESRSAGPGFPLARE